MSRWVKIYDSILNWRWSHKPEYISFMIHCIIRANPTAKKWENLELERGSFICGREDFAKEVGISVQTYRTILKNLQECEFLTAKSTNEGTIITICNYDSYQEVKRQNNQQSTNDSPTPNQRLTTIIEYKNNRIEELKNKEKNTHTEIFKNFQNVCKNNTLAERLTGEFIAYNAEKNQEWWDKGLWKNHVQGFFRRDLKLKGQQTQSPQVAPAPPKVQASAKAPPQPQPEAVAAWKKVLEDLKGEIKLSDYKTWFQPIKPLKLENQTLTINVPTNFFREYLEEYFVKELKKALNKQEINSLNYEIIV